MFVLLGPAQVHALQHLGEVRGVDAAGTRTDRDDGGMRVPLPVEQRLHLELAEQLLDARELGARVIRRRLVRLLVRELDHDLEVVEAARDGRDLREVGLPVAQRARDLLRLVGVVPEVGGAGLL